MNFCAPDDGRVDVRLRASANELRVDVKDNGNGISPEDQQISFEKFRQAGDTLIDKPQRTGLGLPISRQIVGHFKGRLLVESARGDVFVHGAGRPPDREGAGKAPRDRRHTGVSAAQAAERSVAMSKKILIVEDEPNIVRSLQFLMKREGYEVLVAGDGEAALEQIAAHRPDLVLLDVMMPKKNGYEVCQLVRANADWQTIKVILLTAKGRDVDVEKGIAMGADAYVTKPFGTKELVAQVREMLSAR